MKVLKIGGGILAALVTALAVTFFAARFSDGPIGMIPGGPLTSGKMVPFLTVRWNHLRDVETIQLQLVGEKTSRTTWIVTDNAKAYIPASLGFPPGKTWHLRADEKGRAIIRANNERYDVRLDRVTDPEIQARAAELVKRKYAGGPPSDSEVWFFSITSMAPIPDFNL